MQPRVHIFRVKIPLAINDKISLAVTDKYKHDSNIATIIVPRSLTDVMTADMISHHARRTPSQVYRKAGRAG
jgi:hypothetical protein